MTASAGLADWQRGAWRSAAAALAAGRLPHAVLISAGPGTGASDFAAHLARALVCKVRNADGLACGGCIGCRLYAAGTHPDVARLAPAEPGALIKIDQVRAFADGLRLTPQYETGRLGLIDPADRLGASAADSLLKILEEPPAGCHIVLVSARVSAISATIRSRCQLWRLPPADAEAGAAWLAARGYPGAGLDADSLRAPLAAEARAAADFDALAERWDADLARLLRGRASVVAVAERAKDADPALWIDWAYRRSNALLLAELGCPPADLAPALAATAGALGAAGAREAAAAVAEAGRRRYTNADWQLVIEAVLLRLAEAARQQSEHA